MAEQVKSILLAFIPLFVAVDIFAIIPIFTSLTEGMSEQKKQTVERESIITAFVVGISFIAVGEGVFRILNITSDDFKIAGGLILLIVAILDLMGYARIREQEGKMGIVPMGVPLIVGPAVLTTILVLVDHHGIIPTVISLIINLLIVWIAFRASAKILGTFGRGGIMALSKIMALLLASIAVMMIRIGLTNVSSPVRF